jgi:S-DNA-T family DNA segregation ATPase FtsK/SpoIIIE
LAEERARQAEHQHYDDDALTDEEAELEQDELARQFAATQKQRYGDSYAAKRMMETRFRGSGTGAPVCRFPAAALRQRAAAGRIRSRGGL